MALSRAICYTQHFSLWLKVGCPIAPFQDISAAFDVVENLLTDKASSLSSVILLLLVLLLFSLQFSREFLFFYLSPRWWHPSLLRSRTSTVLSSTFLWCVIHACGFNYEQLSFANESHRYFSSGDLSSQLQIYMCWALRCFQRAMWQMGCNIRVTWLHLPTPLIHCGISGGLNNASPGVGLDISNMRVLREPPNRVAVKVNKMMGITRL